MKEKYLYHGTIYVFDDIDLRAGKDFKDFGKGFYASGDKEQANKFAQIIKDREITRQRRLKNMNPQYKINSITKYRYDFVFMEDEAFNDSGLNIKVFKEADLEWIKFVFRNRLNRGKVHNYDIVIGPTADAATKDLINDYRQILKENNYSDEVFYLLLQEVKADKLKKQYYFGSYRALKYLKFLYARKRVIL